MSKRRFVMEFERPLVELEEKLLELRRIDAAALTPELAMEIDTLAAEVDRLHASLYRDLGPWEKVQIARHPDRPKTQDYVDALFEDVIELHGDRAFGDDEAMFAGLGTIAGRKAVVLGHRKGKDIKENIRRNFGQVHPEGFRKARRAMALAGRFGLPVVSFLDTAGAFPGIEAEERGQAWAIAECLATLSDLPVPVVVVGIGEGGSGGALAIGFGDRLIMLENAYYSVISPEMCAVILHKDAAKAAEAAGCLSLTAADLARLDLADEVLPEPVGGAHRDPAQVIEAVGVAVGGALDALATTPADRLVAERYARLRRIGHVVGESGTTGT
ncbi:MAG: acetyl-CoA carboxylase carboxyl transferase subunit alpha [Coriobacteriaceae bacterium]|nr:acetyl-CoA carboxylase carboxyl transferase subunit alpha [Coriobacteriaceae bacterium]